MKVIQAQFVVAEDTLLELAEELRMLCDSHLIQGAEVVVYSVVQNPEINEIVHGGFRWEDRTIQ